MVNLGKFKAIHCIYCVLIIVTDMQNFAKYWALWHTAYNVSPVRWFTVYDNMLLSLGKSVFKPFKNFPS